MPEYTIPKELAATLSGEIREAITPILTRHELIIEKSSTTYGNSFGLKISAAKVEIGPNGVNLGSESARSYLSYCAYHLYDPDALGKIIRLGGTDYVFCGELPRSRKYRWSLRRLADGTMFKFNDAPAIDAIIKRAP